MALTKPKHVHNIPCPPPILSIGGSFTEVLKDFIIEKLLPTNLLQFKKKVRLYAVQEDMATTLTMPYNKTKACYGASVPTVNKLATAFIVDPQLSLFMLVTMLTKIWDRFIKHN